MNVVRAFVLVALCLPIVGCGVKSINDSVAGSYGQEGASRVIEQRVPGPATRPLSLAEVRRQPPDSPQRAVLSMLVSAKLGQATNLASQYDPSALTRLKAGRVASTYARLRAALGTTSFVVHVPKVDGSRATLAVALSEADKPARSYQFGLRKTGGDWRIERDGLYDRALKALCAQQRRAHP